MRIDKTCMTYWLPKLQDAGLPVPRTKMIRMSPEAFRDVFRVFDGEPLKGDAQPFFNEIADAAKEFGYPAFLRTSYTSAKHSWQDTCYLKAATDIGNHVVAIVEFSEIAAMPGLPCEWWAVREFLPTMPVTVCPHYGNMPVCREFRFFVNDSEVRCWHPYWPLEALERGNAAEPAAAFLRLSKTTDAETAKHLASRAGAAVGGAWSVDVIETERGWFITDMAEAEKSWHWPECETLRSEQAA